MMLVTRGGGLGDGELEKGSQNVQTSTDKILQYYGYNAQHDDHSYTTVGIQYVGKLLRE